MTCPHYSLKISTRSKNAPTTAQAAYQVGERLYDERTHRTKNYKNRSGVIHTEIMLPENAPKEYADRNTLWNAVEKAETRWNAQMARRLELALPKELPVETNIEMVREYCQEEFVSKGMIADIAIHEPTSDNDNLHAHIMLTMRAIDEQGNWMQKTIRIFEFDEEGNKIKGEDGKWKYRDVRTTDWDNRDNALKWRQAWEDKQNAFLEAAGRPECISMKSYEEQGIDRIPTVHMGPAVAAMERQGIETNIGNLNREIRKVNGLIEAIKRAIAKLVQWIKSLKKTAEEIEIEPKDIYLVDLLIKRFNQREEERQLKWTSYYGRQKAGVNDLKRFADIVFYMDTENVHTIQQLIYRLERVGEEEPVIRDKLKKVKSRIKTVKNLLAAGKQKAELDPIHDKYVKIYWQGRKEKYAEEHKDELKAWGKAARFIEKNTSIEPYNAKNFGTSSLH